MARNSVLPTPSDGYMGKSSISEDTLTLDTDGKTWIIKKHMQAGRSVDLKTWEYRHFDVMVTDINVERGYTMALRSVLSKLEQYNNDIFSAPESDTEIKRETRLLEA